MTSSFRSRIPRGRDITAIAFSYCLGCSLTSLDHLQDDRPSDAPTGPSAGAGRGGQDDDNEAGSGGLGKSGGGPNRATGGSGGGKPGSGGSGGSGGGTGGGTFGGTGSQAGSGSVGSGGVGGGGSDGTGGAPIGGRTAVFIVNLNRDDGSRRLSDSDAIISARLTGLGYGVDAVDDNDSSRMGEVLAGPATLVALSRTANADIQGLGPALRVVPKPVIVWEPNIYDNMGMVAGENGTRGIIRDATSVLIMETISPLAAGLTGTVQVLSSPSELTFGVPNANAFRVAGIPGQLERCAVFAYDTGAQMPGLISAPARRVGFFIPETGASLVTDAGWSMFDAAVRWADPSGT